MLKLFFARNTCALASHIALEDAGADYEAVRLDFSAGEQRDEKYLAINPKGRVPTLVTDRGALTETPAILAFIAQTFPKAGLAPVDDPFAFGQLQAFNSYLCATVHVAHAHGSRGYRWADEDSSFADMKRKVPTTMGECMATIEMKMLEGPWVFGARYTISRWLPRDSVEIAEFPKLSAHFALMEARPTVQKVLKDENVTS